MYSYFITLKLSDATTELLKFMPVCLEVSNLNFADSVQEMIIIAAINKRSFLIPDKININILITDLLYKVSQVSGLKNTLNIKSKKSGLPFQAVRC